MSTVRMAIERYRSQTVVPTLGTRKSSAKRSDLAEDLMAISHTNRHYFIACFAAVLACLFAAGAITLRFLDSPDRVRAIFGVLGISITGLTMQLTALWKQKVSADLLAVLARTLTEEQSSAVLDKLLDKL